MKIDVLEEPELEFGTGRHIDIRFGLMNLGPLDVASDLAPKRIRVGIAGTAETVEGVSEWLDKCRKEIPAKKSRQPNLFPAFPGFNLDSGFRSTLVVDSQLQRTVAEDAFKDMLTKDRNRAVQEAVEAVHHELDWLAANTGADVLLCAAPMPIVELMDADDAKEGEEGEESGGRLDFHHLLKARSMHLKKPVQIILPMTYDASKRRRQKRRPERTRRLQDEATIAWNIHTALYYKANGIPWRLVRDSKQLTTCYVGVSFFRTLDQSQLHTSMAQVFDERGDGIVVRGGPVELSKEDRQPHLNSEDARKLLDRALAEYRDAHKTMPARIVVHKTSSYDQNEIDGFAESSRKQNINSFDLLSTGDNDVRLFRSGAYPPLRGTFLSVDTHEHLLYTRGSVDFFSTYPGMYIPRPLTLRFAHTQATPKQLAREVLALSKMNWNDTQFDGGQPITVEAARRVGAILKHVKDGDPIAPRYSFYM